MTRARWSLLAAALLAGAWLVGTAGRADDPGAGAPGGLAIPRRLQALDQRVAGAVSPGPLARAHQEISGITRCDDCHTWLGETPDAPCLACHEEIGVRMAGRLGHHGSFAGSCANCHPDHRGVDADLLGLEQKTFAHDQALFALRGAHADLECDECHLRTDQETGEKSFDPLLLPAGASPAVCRDCHESPHGDRLVRARSCEACHSDAGWKIHVPVDAARGLGFDHDADTRFPLDGLHAALACTACHLPGAEAPPARECRSCHGDAVALLAGRFGGRQVPADPHAATTECRGCHPARMARGSLPAYAAVCTECHPRSYATLLATRRALLDEALVKAELAPGVARPGARQLLERLAHSGLHHPELALELAAELGSPP